MTPEIIVEISQKYIADSPSGFPTNRVELIQQNLFSRTQKVHLFQFISSTDKESEATVDRGVVTVTQSHRSLSNYPQSNSGDDSDISPDDEVEKKTDRDRVVPDETDESDDEDEEREDLGFESRFYS